jgi:N-formylglutamate deformylase
MCQSTYMEEVPPYAYDAKLASSIQPVIANMLGAALEACKALYGR